MRTLFNYFVAAEFTKTPSPNFAPTIFLVLKPFSKNCGKGEIRTPEKLTPLPVFETGAFDHSATFPMDITLPRYRIFAIF